MKGSVLIFFSAHEEKITDTPNDYILNVKLKHAATLLKNCPELQIIDISEQAGFSSQQYFSRCFKARYTVSPQEYRKS